MSIIFSTSIFAAEKSKVIDSEFFVKSEGTELYLRVRGQDINNPVLLYLHGGPGEVWGPLLFQGYAGPELEKHFTVAYLHQRGTCKSPSVPPELLTVENFIKDVHNTVLFLKKEFKKDKISLIGHSFGGILGYMYLLEHEETIDKFVSAGGAFSAVALEKNGYETVVQMATEAKNKPVLEKLKSLGPPPYDSFQQGMTWRMIGFNIMNSTGKGVVKTFKCPTLCRLRE